MPSEFPRQLSKAFRAWWREKSAAHGPRGASRLLAREIWEFLRDSTPERRRSRYGDMDYDWQHRVDTTSGTVLWRERLLGVFHSAYQATEPAAFREMMSALAIDYRDFTFIDIGSGKGRTLLMASEYPFPRILGVEILPRLHQIAKENIALHLARIPPDHHSIIESVRMDAREFIFPETPLVVYLFNPLPEAGLRQLIRNLEDSWKKSPRPVWIVYHNPVLENLLTESPLIEKVTGQPQFSLFRMAGEQ